MLDFIKSILSVFLGLVLFATLSTLGLFSLVLISTRETVPRLSDKTLLVLNLSIPVRDSLPATTLAETLRNSLSNTETLSTLRQVLNGLEEASRDPRIVGLYLYSGGESNQTGYANLREIRRALDNFGRQGKPIIAYQSDFTEREYYLSSVADTIALHPMGSLEINGFNSDSPFLAGALERLGVGIQVVRAGKYKSAVEPLVLTRQSSENKQQEQLLLDDLWADFLTETGRSRKLSSSQIQSIVDTQAIVTASEAQKRGLIDRVMYADEVTAKLIELTNENKNQDSFRQISLADYTHVINRAQPGDPLKTNERVAVVYAEGEIVNGQGTPDTIGGDRLARQLRSIRLDQGIKAVVLRINSPGGSATASDIIQREVNLTRQVKPVIISMGNLAASGGYWIATYGDRIFAEPNTITGSIGVFGILPNIQKLTNDNGITWDGVKTGKYADIGTIARPKTSEELTIYQQTVNQVYQQFLTKVSQSRKLPLAQVNQIAQGRVWSGKAAKKLGLVDDLGGLEEAIQAAAKRADLKGQWQVEEFPQPQSWQDQLWGQGRDDQVWRGTLPRMLWNLIQRTIGWQPPISHYSILELLDGQFSDIPTDLTMIRLLNDPKSIYARYPFNFHIR